MPAAIILATCVAAIFVAIWHGVDDVLEEVSHLPGLGTPLGNLMCLAILVAIGSNASEAVRRVRELRCAKPTLAVMLRATLAVSLLLTFVAFIHVLFLPLLIFAAWSVYGVLLMTSVLWGGLWWASRTVAKLDKLRGMIFDAGQDQTDIVKVLKAREAKKKLEDMESLFEMRREDRKWLLLR